MAAAKESSSSQHAAESPYVRAKREHPAVGKFLAALRAGTFDEESRGFDSKWTLAGMEDEQSPTPDAELDSLVHSACGGAGKPDATYARFLDYIGFWLPLFEQTSVVRFYARHGSKAGLRSFRDDIYRALVQQAASSAHPIAKPSQVLVPLGRGPGGQVGMRTVGTGGSPFSPQNEEIMELNEAGMVRPSALCDSNAMWLALDLAAFGRAAGSELPPPARFDLGEEEVVPLLHAHAQLQAGLCPVLAVGGLTDGAAGLLAAANGRHRRLVRNASLEPKHLHAQLERALGDASPDRGVLAFLFVGDLPEGAEVDQLQFWIRVAQAGFQRPLSAVVVAGP